LGAKAGLTATQTFTGTQTIESSSSSLRALIVKGAASQTGTIQEWQTNASSAVASMDIGGLLRANGLLSIQGFTFGRLLMGTTGPIMDVSTPTIPVLRVRGAASQSANLQEWQSSAGTVNAKLDSNFQFWASSLYTNNFWARIGENNSGGQITLIRSTAAGTGTANGLRFQVLSGTNPNTYKFVAIGPSNTVTTILDNIPQ
jgi:hypothetical protein